MLEKSFKKLINSGVTKNEKPQLFIHKGTLCDNCGISPIIGNRYTCLLCQNYDLCEYCENSDPHTADHPMVKFRTPQLSIAEKQVEDTHVSLTL
jgi:hypothetical protein